ncbi:hypothetical protein DR79_1449 [Francisella tularensis]|nr:hypothetical protein [Francisella tularensis]ADA77996.1 hypothetical protein NE061598_01730 [Francisella tularensis subsp. tularensis NE061598]AJI68564.1 hypothetical protein BZ14_554 [Francisella tularensis subsp. tularensis SCHU S4]AJI70442.1 hypothetical protein CH69_91 [Francisella tularensis subsp. tularensis]AKE20479.1 hypothetical protein RO31_0347 [Francisella tularensis subsp. tularensis str. SCHU S4 substr. NR-28534]APS93015.1 hypothetical protein AV531_02190 [Francisella tularens
MKIRKLSLIMSVLLFATAIYANNHFGNNLAGCGLNFDPINLQDTANWKDKLIKNDDQSKLKTIHKSIQFNTTKRNYVISPLDIQLADSLPAVGKWMMVNTSSYNKPNLPQEIAATWVYWRGAKDFVINGVAQPQSYTVEPINAVFVLEGFLTAKEANNYLINLFAQLGYSNTDSINHSGGYGVYFDGKLYPQLLGTPTNTNDVNVALTFEKDIADFADHFRLMGPYILHQNDTKKFIYAISISRESLWFKSSKVNCGNLYISFRQAENTLITSVINELPTVKIYSASLDNYIEADSNFDTSTTGDHTRDSSFVSVFIVNKNN